MDTNQISFTDLLTYEKGEDYLDQLFNKQSNSKKEIFKPWYKETGAEGEVYPSQGLLLTPFDYLSFVGKTLTSEDELWKIIRMRRYMLEIFNHPDRIKHLLEVEESSFQPPPRVISKVMEEVLANYEAISIHDLGMAVVGTDKRRVSRRSLLQTGPFIKLGKFARIPFSGGAMPDIFGSPSSLASLAASHALVCIPRNGVFSDLNRQADLAKEAFKWMKAESILINNKDREKLLLRWQHNLVGVIEPETKPALVRAKALYKEGVRTFRVYSPEPGVDAAETIIALRKLYKDKIEIFAGQVATVDQAKVFQEAGADGLYTGIGGGGRCTTAARSDSVVNWPNLLWKLRGKINIPVIVEGGASEYIGLTLALGASAVGVSRSVGGGTIESPGGLLYLVNSEGQWYKPYGGEASARTKYLDKKMMACGLPAFIEGQTTKAIKSYIPHVLPTLVQNVHFLTEDLILGMVFRGVKTIEQLQSINPSPIRRITASGSGQQHTH
jgi:hypothetical protein